jgi:hypothetical protein
MFFKDLLTPDDLSSHNGCRTLSGPLGQRPLPAGRHKDTKKEKRMELLLW